MDEIFKPSRRTFLRGSAAIAAGTVAGQAAAQGTPDPKITELQDWASYTGVGVDETPYGLPISFESDVVRMVVREMSSALCKSTGFRIKFALRSTDAILFAKNVAGWRKAVCQEIVLGSCATLALGSNFAHKTRLLQMFPRLEG